MDADRFDRFTRAFGAALSRRAALGGVLAGLLAPLAASEDLTARKHKQRKRKRHKAEKQDRQQNRKKGRKQNRKQGRPPERRQNQAQSEAARCCSRNNCTPGKGKNLFKCCYQDQDLSGQNFSGANLGQADFSGADVSGADFRSANLGQTCFVDADTTGARFGGTNTGTAIFCRTRTDSGEDNSGCDRGTPCCPTCDDEHPCDADALCCNGRCVAGTCCDNGEQSTCGADQLCCQHTCVAGVCCRAADCPNQTCQRRRCADTHQCEYTAISGRSGPGCADPRVCCQDAAGAPVCCEEGQVCDAAGLCCTAPSRDELCGVGTSAPRCGEVTDTCGQRVDCGPCAERTCEAGTCTGEQTCAYTPVSGESGPGCAEPRVCCQDADGTPACCNEGVTSCQPSGVCGCATAQDCGGDDVCCDEQCVSGVCCRASDCPNPGVCHRRRCDGGHQCDPEPVFDDSGPGCDTTCCQDADGAPVCCEAGQACDENGQCSAPCDVCESGCQYDNLQDAIADASLATIRVCPGTFPTNALILQTTRDITVIGAGSGEDGTILDGGGNGRVLDIIPPFVGQPSVRLENLTITGGRATQGAGILNSQDLTLVNCTVRDNEVTGNDRGGGGILNTRRLTLVNSTVRNNTAAAGAGIFNAGFLTLEAGTAIRNNVGRVGVGILNVVVTIMRAGSSVTFNETNDPQGSGAGIANAGTALPSGFTNVILEPGSVVSDNTADHQGGGVFNFSGETTLFAGSSVTRNHAGNDGGGVYEEGGSVSVGSDDVVTFNTAGPDNDLNNCRPEGAVPFCLG